MLIPNRKYVVGINNLVFKNGHSHFNNSAVSKEDEREKRQWNGRVELSSSFLFSLLNYE